MHPYTRGLLAARPRLGSRTPGGRGRLTELDQVVTAEERGRDAPTLTTPRSLHREATA
jgi:peptide/nickel transport system ATP-binding protein